MRPLTNAELSAVSGGSDSLDSWLQGMIFDGVFQYSGGTGWGSESPPPAPGWWGDATAPEFQHTVDLNNNPNSSYYQMFWPAGATYDQAARNFPGMQFVP